MLFYQFRTKFYVSINVLCALQGKRSCITTGNQEKAGERIQNPAFSFATAVVNQDHWQERHARKQHTKRVSATRKSNEEAYVKEHFSHVITPPAFAFRSLNKYLEDMPDNFASSKKPRLEGKDGTLENETSPQVTGENEGVDADNTPFTLVTYKKQRKQGIPVAFRPLNTTLNFWHVKHLLSLTSVAGLSVKPSIPESYTRNVGKIRFVPPQYTDHQLLDYLKDFGVLSVRRQQRFKRKEDGTIDTRPATTVILQFRSDRPMPERIFLGFTSHPVEEYFGPAVRCYNCQRFGHMARNCRQTRRCKICAQDHDHKQCNLLRQPHCANCGGDHAASFSGCPQYKQASQLRKEELLNGPRSRFKMPSPNPEVVNHVQLPPPRAKPEIVNHVQLPSPRATDNSQPLQNKSYVSALQNAHIQRSEHQRPSRNSAILQDPAKALPSADISPKSQVGAMPESASTNTNAFSMDKLIFPMLFAAVRAIVAAVPQASDVPEVKALLAMEPLLCSLHTLVPRNFDNE